MKLAAAILIAALAAALPARASDVRVTGAPGSFQLTVDGHPFQVKGASGFDRIDALKAAGGNTVRLYGAAHTPLLDEAEKHGLKAIMGLDLAPARKGFAYTDPAQVQAQKATVKDFVARHRNHPALLIWALGNELELEAPGDPKPIWRAVEDAARTVRRIDPHHPTVVVVAEVTPQKIADLNALAPSVDILGINAYGGAGDAVRRAREAGWARPVLLTEFGPLGHWEMPKTAWGAPIEQPSVDKAKIYLDAWTKGVAAERGWALGGIAFLWGAKQETTATWYGMFLDDGRRLAAVDAVTFAWTGRWPGVRAPVIGPPTIARDVLRPGETIAVDLWFGEPAPVTVGWTLAEESQDRGVGGDAERAPPMVPGAIKGAGARVTLTAPARPGAYRLFAIGYGPDGTAATANRPILVQAP